MKLVAMTGTVMLLVAATTAIQAGSIPAPLPHDSDLGLTLDGNLESAYASNFSSIQYTRDQGGVFTGQISVVETQEAYWIGFVQAFNAKSNSYCANTNSSPGCYQNWRDLVGSDYIGFSWPSLPVNGTNQLACINVGIIYQTTSGAWTSGPGDNDGRNCAKNAAGLQIQGFPAGAADGKSAVDYNVNVNKWTDFNNSPNFAGQPNYPYIYPSIAEVRIDKALAHMSDGLASQIAKATVVAHDSPMGPVTNGKQVIGINCTGSNTVEVGQTATFPVTVSIDGVPPGTPQQVIASVSDSNIGTVVSVGGTPGNIGPTTSNGTADVVVKGIATGTFNVTAVWDANKNGAYDAATDPVTPTSCPLTVPQTGNKITVGVTKTNNANADSTFTKDETPKVGADVPFKAVIHNPSAVPVRILSLSDEWPNQAAFDLTDASCTSLINTVLAAGADSAPCTFTLTGYSPAAGTSRENTVRVRVEEAAKPGNTADASDTSIVRSPYIPPPPPEITFTLDKVNNADGVLPYSKSETAPSQGASVPFQVTITNTSTVDVVITKLTDEWPGQAAFTPGGSCGTLVGAKVLTPAGTPGASVTCDFTQANYAPPKGTSLVDTVVVSVAQTTNLANTLTKSSISTVTTAFLPPPPPPISLTVDKTNNADGINPYSKNEAAPNAGADVPFQVVVHNTSPVAVNVDSFTDQWPGQAAFTPGGTCGALVNTTMQPDETKTCTFSQTGYAPAAGSSLTDTIVVTVSDLALPANKATASSTSTVYTPLPPPPVISFTLNKLNDANGDSAYTKAEVAPNQGAAVPFQVTITNTSPVAVDITSFTDQWPGVAPFVPAGTCGPLLGTALAAAGQPGSSVTCGFTQNGYAPARGSSLIDTVVVTVVQHGNTGNSLTGYSQSTVTTPLAPPPPPNITMTVNKFNDANGDSTFTKSETAPNAGATVPFKVTIANTSNVSVDLTSITDQWPGRAAFVPDGPCEDLLGVTTLAPMGQPGDSVVCSFTLTGYAPPEGTTLIDTVVATVVEHGNPANSASASSTSAVSTGITPPPPPQITVTVNKTNDGNLDGTFTKSEVAPVPGANLPYRAVVTNTSGVPVVLTALTDTVPGATASPICPELIGTVLAPKASATCEFTGPAPVSGASLTDTVTTIVVEKDNPGNTATATSQSTVKTLPVITGTIVKTNDGNGDGTFTDNETAPTPGAPVPYRIVVTNTSGVPVVLTALTDVFPGGTPVGVCANLLNTVLSPGASVTCNFTAPAPAVGPDVTDTAQATLVDLANPNNGTIVQDVSTVRTVQVLGLVVSNPPATPAAPAAVAPAQLARTGTDARRHGQWGMLLLGLGLMTVGMTGLHRPREQLDS
jgi:uncharacterized repeat protein (TIGR01451 family)